MAHLWQDRQATEGGEVRLRPLRRWRVDPIVLAHERDGGHGERRLRRQALLQGLQGGIAGHGADPVTVGMQYDLDEVRIVEGGGSPIVAPRGARHNQAEPPSTLSLDSFEPERRSRAQSGRPGVLGVHDTDDHHRASLLTLLRINCALIGAGVRMTAKHVPELEQVLNAVRKAAPQMPIAFNASPDSSA